MCTYNNKVFKHLLDVHGIQFQNLQKHVLPMLTLPTWEFMSKHNKFMWEAIKMFHPKNNESWLWTQCQKQLAARFLPYFFFSLIYVRTGKLETWTHLVVISISTCGVAGNWLQFGQSVTTSDFMTVNRYCKLLPLTELHTHACTHTQAQTHACTCVRVHTHACMHAHAHACVQACAHRLCKTCL